MDVAFTNQRMDSKKINATVISTRGRDLILQLFKISPSGRNDSSEKDILRKEFIYINGYYASRPASAMVTARKIARALLMVSAHSFSGTES